MPRMKRHGLQTSRLRNRPASTCDDRSFRQAHAWVPHAIPLPPVSQHTLRWERSSVLFLPPASNISCWCSLALHPPGEEPAVSGYRWINIGALVMINGQNACQPQAPGTPIRDHKAHVGKFFVFITKLALPQLTHAHTSPTHCALKGSLGILCQLCDGDDWWFLRPFQLLNFSFPFLGGKLRYSRRYTRRKKVIGSRMYLQISK